MKRLKTFIRGLFRGVTAEEWDAYCRMRGWRP